MSILDQYPLPDLAPNPLVICGEFMIITHPNFTAAANTLRNWKVQKGISTFVVETGNGSGKAGTTTAQIHQFIQSRYANCVIRPSYLLLLGDDSFIPTYIADVGDESWATDLGYALMANPFYDAGIVGVIPIFHDLGEVLGINIPIDYLPDLAYGRMPVDTLAQANIMVNKTIAYEKTPPQQTSFYSNMTFASVLPVLPQRRRARWHRRAQLCGDERICAHHDARYIWLRCAAYLQHQPQVSRRSR